jgi:hypothetical protein
MTWGWACWRWAERPGEPATIPMASAGSRGKHQEVRAHFPAGRPGRGRGGQPSAVPRSWTLAHQLTPGPDQGGGNRSP